MKTLVYLNGAYLPADEAALPIYDAGLVQGATVTVQARTFGKRLWKLEDRLDRLFEFLRALDLDIETSRDALQTISLRLLEHNGQLVDENAELGLLLFVTAGEYASYAASSGRQARDKPTVCIHTFPIPFHRWAKKMASGGHLVIPSVRQVPAVCWSPQIKCRSECTGILPTGKCNARTPKQWHFCSISMAISPRRTRGICCWYEAETLLSPLTQKILPGLSRAMVIELAKELGIAYRERNLTVEDVLTADEAMLTSTPYCILPVTRINSTQVGNGRHGAITHQLQVAWSAKVGVDIVSQFVI